MANKPHSSASDPSSSTPLKVYSCSRGFLSGVEHFLLYIGVACVVALAILITSSVLLRTFFHSGIPDEIMIVGEFMVGALVLPLAFVAASRGFIAVEILTLGFGEKVQQFLNLLTAVVGVIAVLPITYAALLSFIDVVQSGAYFFGILEIPKWPGRGIFLLGYALFFIRLIDLSIYDALVLSGIIKNTNTHNLSGEHN